MVHLRFDRLNSREWHRVCEVASLLLDAGAAGRPEILARECGADAGLRAAALALFRDYSESEDLFGAQPLSQSAPCELSPGKRIGAWRVLQALGEGGMGRVYLVERDDQGFSRRAALKLIRGYYDAESVRRFESERRILGLLDHPGIARALDGGATPDGAPYLVMEYIDGSPIDHYSKGRAPREILRLFLQVIETIEAAHQRLVVHRDLKPSNILVDKSGQAKVVDFGIAKLLEEGNPLERTHTAWQALTPVYASPEQFLHQPIGTFTDVYSLGAVLYKLLTGRPPHDLTGQNGLFALRVVTETDPPPPSRYAREVARDLDWIVLKALERDPARRYSSAAEMAADIRRFLDGRAVCARQATIAYRAGKFLERNRLYVALLAVVTMAVLPGIFTTIREKGLAERRFQTVRQLAHQVIFDYQDELSRLAGSTEPRERVAADTARYLDSLLSESGSDIALEREIASAYRKTGEIEGYGRVPNLGKWTEARASLVKSVSVWQAVCDIDGRPEDRVELAISMERLASVETEIGQLAEARKWIDRSLALFGGSSLSDAVLHRAKSAAWVTASRLAQREGEGMKAIDAARRGVQELRLAPENLLDPQGIAMARMQLAICDNDYGLPDPKLLAEGIGEARAAVKAVGSGGPCRDIPCRETEAALLKTATIVFAESGVVEEAIPLTRSVDILEDLLRLDPDNRRILTNLRGALEGKISVFDRLGRPEEALKTAYRMLQVSEMLAGTDAGQSELSLNVARALSAVGVELMRLGRYTEGRPYLVRANALSDRPASENVDWLIYRNYTHQLMAQFEQHRGNSAVARDQFRISTEAAAAYLRRAPAHPYAMMLDADSRFRLARALRPFDRVESCSLLRQSLDGYQRLIALGRPLQEQWAANAAAAERAIESCSGRALKKF